MKGLGYTLLALSAMGTTQIANAELRDAADFDAAGFTITPTLNASIGYDDNITTTPSNELSANVYKLAPELKAKTEFGDFVGLDLNTKAEKGVYSGQSFNNYYDYSFGTGLGFRLSSKQSLALNYDFSRSHDPAGSPTAVAVNAIEKYRTNSGTLAYKFGNKDSVARLEFAVSGEGKRYKEQASSGKNFDSEKIDATVFVGVAPRTEVFVQAIAGEYDFITVNALDNDDTQAYLGVKWEATAKTTGSVKIGKQEKDYTQRTPKLEQDETVWEAGVKWEPRSYSAFTLDLSRSVGNGNGTTNTALTENAVDRTTTAIGWEHKWSDDVKTTTAASLNNEEYLGGTRNGIEADILAFNAGLEFKVERNFTLHMNYSYTDKEAENANGTTATAEEYSQSSAVVFGVEIGL